MSGRSAGDTWACSDSGITVKFLNTNPSDKPRWAALKLPRSEKQEWDAIFGTNKQLQVLARCWWGTPGERPSNDAKLLNMSNTASKDGGTTLVGKLPSRDGNYGTKYSCNFGFQQKYTSNPFPVEVATPFRDATTVTDFPAYIVAGSNQIQPIQVNVPSGPFSGNIPDGFDFKEKAGNTENPSGDNIFQHFPTGALNPDIGARNPTTVCEKTGPCPN